MSNVISLIEKMAIEGKTEILDREFEMREELAASLEAISEKNVIELENILNANTKIMSLMVPAEDEDEDEDEDEGANESISSMFG